MPVEEVLVTAIITALVTAVVTSGISYLSITNRLSVVETLIKSLCTETAKHNSYIERTYALEANSKRHDEDIDELYERMRFLESHKIGGSD